MFAREYHQTQDSAEEAALAYAEETGGEDVYRLSNGLWESFPTSLRDLHRMIDPVAVLFVGNIQPDGECERVVNA